MKKIENNFNFFLACLMAAVALACLAVYFLAAVWGKGKDPALLAAAFVVAVWAVTDFSTPSTKSPSRSGWRARRTSGTCTWP